MTVWRSVGRSRLGGEMFGVEQFMDDRAAVQVLAFIEFVADLPGCRRLTVNEGRRTRARQSLLRRRWEAYRRGGPWAPLAAVEFTSKHDEVRHGNAADLGGPNGEALNAAERAAISIYGPRFGIEFTGMSFSPAEPWHVQADRVTPIPAREKEEDMAFTADDRRFVDELVSTRAETYIVNDGRREALVGPGILTDLTGKAELAGVMKFNHVVFAVNPRQFELHLQGNGHEPATWPEALRLNA